LSQRRAWTVVPSCCECHALNARAQADPASSAEIDASRDRLVGSGRAGAEETLGRSRHPRSRRCRRQGQGCYLDRARASRKGHLSGANFGRRIVAGFAQGFARNVLVERQIRSAMPATHEPLSNLTSLDLTEWRGIWGAFLSMVLAALTIKEEISKNSIEAQCGSFKQAANSGLITTLFDM
jgi:hypothetical protein